MTTTTATDGAGLSVYNPNKNVGTGSGKLDQSSFLTLLTAQMQFQDPFEPVKNSDMVAQVATITNSSGIAEMNQTLKNLANEMSGTRLGDAASWIGKSMLVESNVAVPDAAGTYAGQVTLPAAVKGASIDLIDGDGNTVKTIDMGSQQAGDVTFFWDGKDDTGKTVTTSALQVKVKGATPTKVATWATIAAVQSPADGSSSKLITALGSHSPSDAISLM
ncbi:MULTISPECIES: flagellar hook assembly protein FlgD [unclassified Sphingobium]|uniref:flagellar hook assembly protein FlgD n=1 Tax=unclassified Sphingobium TaxID=2611147 RepID=UPI0035A6E577